MRYSLILSLFISLFVQSQYENAHWEGNEFEVGKTYFTFGNELIIRSQPDKTSEKLASIPLNQPIELLELTDESLTINNHQSSWLKVSVKDSLIGYVASTFIATGRSELKNGQYLLYKRRGTDLSIRMTQKSKEFIELGTYTMGNYNFLINVKSNLGLDGIDHVIHVDYLAEACGEEGGSDYFTLNIIDGELVHLGMFSSVADAGAFYSTETLVFPDDENGQPGKIIYKGEITTFLDYEMDDERTISRSKSYKWLDGKLEQQIKKFTYDW